MAPSGHTIERYEWRITQGEVILADFAGPESDFPDVTSAVVGGTYASLQLNPTELSPPSLARVSIADASGVNQLFQSGLTVFGGTEYEVSLVAASDLPGSLSVRLLEHRDPFGGLGLNHSFDTSQSAAIFRTRFTGPHDEDNARLWLDFPEGSYWVDNVELRAVGQESVIANGSFDDDSAWSANFAGGGQFSVEDIPAHLANFPETNVQLAVVDSQGERSLHVTHVLTPSPCSAREE